MFKNIVHNSDEHVVFFRKSNPDEPYVMSIAENDRMIEVIRPYHYNEENVPDGNTIKAIKMEAQPVNRKETNYVVPEGEMIDVEINDVYWKILVSKSLLNRS